MLRFVSNLIILLFISLVTQTGCLVELPKDKDSGDTVDSTDTAGTDDTVSSGDGDTDSDTDTDTDGDSDGDTDTDSDTDTDTDSDTDTDTDSDTDTDTDSDTDNVVCEPFETKTCENAVGNCADGVQTCREDGTDWGPCSILPEDKDSCDPGDDANCNGIVNEECSCVEGDTQDCGPENAVGICKKGTVSCKDGRWDTECVGQVLPKERDCGSDQDNDCNGIADNTIDESCKCIPGAKRVCDPYQRKGVGICTLGEQTCEYVSGKSGSDWGECIGAVPPEKEICDSEELDEDCDGTGNEGCDCSEDDTKACGTNEGICEYGEVTCVGGKWSSTCEGGVTPQKRDCTSSKDNDCDSFADNILDSVCQCKADQSRDCVVSGSYGVCQAGTQSCVMASDKSSSHWGVCERVVSPSKELCNGDGLDENCDGNVNEGCECTNGYDIKCDDGLACTDDSCVDGQCTHEIKASYCLIDNQCIANNAVEQGNLCRYCNATKNNTGWTNRSSGASCDDGVFCNGQDTCDASGKCVNSGNPCNRNDEECYSTTCNENLKGCYTPASKICDDEYGVEYKCDDDSCGGQILKRTLVRYCSGNSYGCNGRIENGSWESSQTCSDGQVCSGGLNPSCVSNFKCECELSGNYYDSNTDLCWRKTPIDVPVGWGPKHCSEGTWSGYTDWELPTIEELISLIRGCQNGTEGKISDLSLCTMEPPGCVSDETCHSISNCLDCDSRFGPGTDGCYFSYELDGNCGHYWSSTSGTDPLSAWAVSFDHGTVFLGSKLDSSYYVRCVQRGPLAK